MTRSKLETREKDSYGEVIRDVPMYLADRLFREMGAKFYHDTHAPYRSRYSGGEHLCRYYFLDKNRELGYYHAVMGLIRIHRSPRVWKIEHNSHKLNPS